MRSFLLVFAFVLSFALCPAAQLDETPKKAGDALQQKDTSSLSDSKIIDGLKRALRLSTSKTVARRAARMDS